MTTTVHLMRHPEPDVTPGCCYGQLDVGLRPGWITTLSAELATLEGTARIITSPLHRCLAPAEWLGERLAASVVRDPRLMELDFGDWEGRFWVDFDGPESRAWAADFVNRAPPGGESLQALADRVEAAVDDHADGTHCLFMTHGGPIRALLARERELPLSRAFELSVPFATPVPLACDQRVS